MRARILVASGIAVVITAAFLPGSGFGSSRAHAPGARALPAGLVAAIHARFGAAPIPGNAGVRGAAGPTFGPQFGVTVSISSDGTTALVGSGGLSKKPGAAYVYHVSDAGSWTSNDTPTATLTNGTKSFATAVALSADGTTAFVGAPNAGGGKNPPGAIYVFHVASEDAWVSSSTPMATLTVPASQYLGYPIAVSADGTTLVAGVPQANVMAGGAYVFHATSEDAWATTSTPTATLTYANESRNDAYVGSSVAISGDGTTILLGDAYNPTGGGAYVYRAVTEDTWTTSVAPLAILTNAFGGASDDLGYSVALSGDGTVALLGAPRAHSYAGAADVFGAASAAAWTSTSTPTAILTAGTKKKPAFLGFGAALSTDGATALLGAPVAHFFRGGAFVFHVSAETAWASTSKPTAALSDSHGHFNDILGIRVALSGDGATALLGAPDVHATTGAAEIMHASDSSSWASTSHPTAVLSDKDLEACVVPGLVGAKLSQAKAVLKYYSCRLGKVRRVPSKAKPGRVVAQNRKPGSRLKVGAKVNVKVST